MKRINYILLLILCGLVTTGFKYNSKMWINSDKSLGLSIVYAVDRYTAKEEDYFKEEDFSEYKNYGFTIQKYDVDSYDGYELIKNITNIDEVSSEEDVIYDLNKLTNNNNIFKVIKEKDKNTYIAKFKLDSSSFNTLEETGDIEDLEDMEEPIDGVEEEIVVDNNEEIIFNVKLPSKAINSNATIKENDGKSLSWVLNDSNELFEFSFEFKNEKDNKSILVELIITIVIVAAVLWLSKKRNERA